MTPWDFDIIIVGAGLAGGLTALKLRAEHPNLRILVLEKGQAAGGHHTWCFHGSDVEAPLATQAWLLPLIEHNWQDYEVHFPEFTRRLTGTYHCIRSPRFASVISEKLGTSLWTGARVASTGATQVTLADGRRLKTRIVLDARGWQRYDARGSGYQKFFGMVVQTSRDHGLVRPVLMDARVKQEDGYRFVYTLPFTSRELLVEDTRYSNGDDLDRAALRNNLLQYVSAMGLNISSVVGEEEGRLPIPLSGATVPKEGPGEAVRIGAAGGLFNPATGYSTGEAIRFANWFSAHWTCETLPNKLDEYRQKIWERGSFQRRLNSMLFAAARPEDRRGIMARFYQHPEPMIQRFYAGKMSTTDKLRTIAIKPPVPLFAAMRTFLLPQSLEA